MAEALVAQYGPDVPQAIARMVAAVYPGFDTDAFLSDALRGYRLDDLWLWQGTLYRVAAAPVSRWSSAGAKARVCSQAATRSTPGSTGRPP